MERITVITHRGIFHADDCFAAAWLQLRGEMLGVDVSIQRRNPTSEELDNPHIIIFDVGGTYDRSKSNFDHHMRGDDKPLRWDNEVPYSSFGLIFESYPMPDITEGVAERLLRKLVLSIDAVDNGVKNQEGEIPFYSVSMAISSFNPVNDVTDPDRDLAFCRAVSIAREIIKNEISLARKQEEDKAKVLSSPIEGGILIMEKECLAGWQETILDSSDHDDVKFVVFPSLRGGYMVQSVPASLGSFDTRKSLKEDLGGLRDEDLRRKSGVKDAIFVHPGRFCGGAESIDGCIALAEMSM